MKIASSNENKLLTLSFMTWAGFVTRQSELREISVIFKSWKEPSDIIRNLKEGSEIIPIIHVRVKIANQSLFLILFVFVLLYL